MSIFKRAWLYVARKRGKTILLFAILLIMATFVLTGLSIWKASEAAQLDLRQSLGGKFDIFVDWSNSPYVVRETVQDNEVDEETGKTTNSFLMYSTVQFTPEDIAAIKGVSGVKHCGARQDNLLPFEGISLFPGTVAMDAKYQGYTKALGVCGTEDDELFTTGTLTLAEGRHISADDTHVAIISRDLAERNELKIGDYLTAHSYSVEDQGYTGQEIRVQVIGLFAPNAVEQFGETVTTYDKIQNRVFVDLQTSREMDGGTINYGFSALHVSVDDPQDMAEVIADVKALPGIDWTAFTVEADNETYESAAAPLATLNELVFTLLVVIIAVSAIILALILTLWTKTRIHEIGVFLSVGIGKSAIIGQYLTEVMLVAVLAFGLSYFTSSAIAGQIGNHLLEQSMRTEPEDDEMVSAVAAAVDVGADTLIQKPLPTEDGIRVSVGLNNLVRLYLIGFAIIIVAVSASSVTVMRLKPREILSKMS
ncbi:ABC transporter permease [uncultured Acetatifactor sp.]|uniref:ABC transporter permease n=1 Tax=uncultured Acetatifactor sp. TaxID=1671927 RepID=UPI002605CA60|nr:ABC transporter permease [uncultured Acetatifactor sp.]